MFEIDPPLIFSHLTRLSSGSERIWQSVDFPHNLFPRLINGHEHLSLSWELALNIGGTEDALKVQPVALASKPLVL